MVGVPGKSKGCHTCRRRKVKCDEKRPSCDRCFNSGRECQGYQKRAVFLNRAQTGLLKRGPLEEAIMHTEPGPILFSQRQRTLNRQMNLTPVWKRKIEGYFLEKFLADDYSSQKPTPGYFVFECIYELSRDPLLESSIQSLCLTRVGRMNNDDRLLQQGFESYTIAVRRLHIAMSQASTRTQDSTLAAAKIMNLYEFYEPSYHSGMAVYNHTIGVEMLASLREDNGDVKPKVMKALLRSTRYNSMIACIKGFSSDSPFACSKPEDVNGSSIENLEHMLMDIGFVIATIVHDYEHLRLQLLSNEFPLGIEKLAARCCEVFGCLQTWYIKLTERSTSPLYWTSIEERSILESETPSFDFSHISMAHILIDYWALSIIIGRALEQLSLFIKSRPLSTFVINEEALEIFHMVAAKNCSNAQIEFALKILASVDFCDREETGLAGKDHLFGLGISLRLFRMLSGPKAKALEQRTNKILHRIADDGLQFARCLIQQALSEIQERISTTEESHMLAEIRWGSGYQG